MGKTLSCNRAARRRRGMSLLEVLVSVAVLTVGLAGFLQTIVTVTALESSNQDQVAANAAARAVLEQLRSTTFNEVFRRFNASGDDDPVGGASPGAAFDVVGLRPLPGQNFPGAVRFPVDPANPDVLREDLVDAQLGMPLDLNADGALTNANCAGDYRLLPVVVTVEWQSSRGPASLEIRTILGGLQ